MRVFVTGGTGFIGQALVERLLRADHKVMVLTRNLERGRSKLGSEVELLPYAEGPELVDALSKVEGVVNLAGEPVLPARWTDKKKRRLVESRVDLTQSLVRALAAATPKPRVLVSASAVGYYGRDSGPSVRTESEPPADDFLARLCVDWEAAAREAEAHGVRVTRVRIGLVLGRNGGALEQLLTPFKLGLGGRIGSGEQYMPWIHLHDLVEMMVAALEDDRFPSVVNGTAPHPVTNEEFTKALGRVLGRPTVLPVPGFAMKLVLGEAAGALLGGQNAVPAAALAHGFPFAFDDLEACLRDVV